MKCPNCSSQMFITDETVNSRSHVIFFRCSVCISEHVSSEPIMESLQQPAPQQANGFTDPATTRLQFAF
jgi:DNA-directed RNA polymerase subunit M/transcription elongation factor TFIIS